MIRTHGEIRAERPPLSISGGPQSRPESTLSDQGAATHTRVGSDDLSGAAGLSGGVA
jgi:hypothetical protein